MGEGKWFPNVGDNLTLNKSGEKVQIHGISFSRGYLVKIGSEERWIKSADVDWTKR